MVMMAGISDDQKKKDFQMMLACSTHLGTKNLDFQMTRYVWKRKPDGIHIINLGRTYDKLLLAARIIVAIENPADVCVISARPYGQRSILKYCQYTGATPIAARQMPRSFGSRRLARRSAARERARTLDSAKSSPPKSSAAASRARDRGAIIRGRDEGQQRRLSEPRWRRRPRTPWRFGSTTCGARRARSPRSPRARTARRCARCWACTTRTRRWRTAERSSCAN